jgi:hypothetical protein
MILSFSPQHLYSHYPARFLLVPFSKDLGKWYNNSERIWAKLPNFEISVDSQNLSAKFLPQ